MNETALAGTAAKESAKAANIAFILLVPFFADCRVGFDRARLFN
jgi:hypothetical protein